MPQRDYASFLPEPYQPIAARPPESTWWTWRDRSGADHEVHLARAADPHCPVRLLLIHGAGGHSAALWPLGALLADRGIDICAIDLPLYGRTRSPQPGSVRYGDWVDLLVDLVADEDDGRPVILLGASIGGLLALEVAARSDLVAHIAATCLLDPADWRARARMTRFGPFGIPGRALAALPLVRTPRIADRPIPMRWVANLSRMSRSAELSERCADDPLGGGAAVPIGFLTSYLRFEHTPAEQIRTPVTLLHPTHDDWTPVELSMRVLRRVAGPTRLVLLRQAGHFPIEEPGVSDLVTAVEQIAADLS